MKRFPPNDVIYRFEHAMPAKHQVATGEVFEVATNDCFYQQIHSSTQVLEQIDADRLNPATGPIAVEGAAPGDLLKVEILAIDVAEQGVSITAKNEGLLGKHVKEAIVRPIPVKDGVAEYLGLKLPIDPMVGVIGVAPAAEDGAWPTHSPWKHGGNMDTKDIRAGSTLYFQVAAEGAQLALGDLHAIMGDGEICFTGLEIPGIVQLKLEVIKQKRIAWPMLETKEDTQIIASGKSLREAMEEANLQAVNIFAKALKVSWEEAYILASLTVDSKISQVVNPMVTVRAAIPQHVLSTEKILAVL